MKATKLKSGNWRVRAYSHDEIVTDQNGNVVYQDGKPKKKKVMKSFTAKTKKEAMFLAAQFALEKKSAPKIENITLLEAIDRYIELKSVSLSPTTLRDYDITKRYAFQDIMHMKMDEFSEDIIQMAVNRESCRNVARLKAKKKKNIDEAIKERIWANQDGYTEVQKRY